MLFEALSGSLLALVWIGRRIRTRQYRNVL